MNVRFFGSQIGGETASPLSYTGSSWYLLVHDIYLFIRWSFYLPNIVLPVYPSFHELDELHPSRSNMWAILLHTFAFVAQSIFLISLPCLLYMPIALYAAYIIGFMIINRLFCKLLNGKIPKEGLQSTRDTQTESWPKHENESWIFLNGVAVGDHWLQSNIDRISRTFGRPVVGIHNQTSGIMFDVIQCLIQRCLLYATPDVRDCYVLVKKALYREGCNKVILILHSQGGIEGSMIIDWLLNEVPQNKLKALEVYTFGNAANHFNNPYRDSLPTSTANGIVVEKKFSRAISHIEHYANSQDFVSCWGVLNYTRAAPRNKFENRFMGRVFERHGGGHQFNQHYLDNMFPLNESGHGARDPIEGDFMELNCESHGGSRAECESPGQSLFATMGNDASGLDVHLLNESPSVSRKSTVEIGAREITNNTVNGTSRRLQVKDLSRLWTYRNGLSPPDT